MSLSFGFWAPYDLKKLLTIAPTLADFGYKWVEVAAPSEIKKKWVNAVEKLKRDNAYQVSVHSRFRGVNLSSPNTTMRKAAVKVLCEDVEFCLQVGSPILVVHGGDTGWCDILPQQHPQYENFTAMADHIREESLSALTQAMVEVVERYKDTPVKLAIENLYFPWELLPTPEEMAHFITDERLSGLGVTLDMGHARVVGKNPNEFLNLIGDRLAHVHIHGNDGLYDLHEPLTELPQGWAEALTRMHSLPQDLAIIMEWHDSNLINYLNSLKLCLAALNQE